MCKKNKKLIITTPMPNTSTSFFLHYPLYSLFVYAQQQMKIYIDKSNRIYGNSFPRNGDITIVFMN